MFFANRLGMLHNTGIARFTDQITKKENTHEKLSLWALPDRSGNLIRDAEGLLLQLSAQLTVGQDRSLIAARLSHTMPKE